MLSIFLELLLNVHLPKNKRHWTWSWRPVGSSWDFLTFLDISHHRKDNINGHIQLQTTRRVVVNINKQSITFKCFGELFHTIKNIHQYVQGENVYKVWDFLWNSPLKPAILLQSSCLVTFDTEPWPSEKAVVLVDMIFKYVLCGVIQFAVGNQFLLLIEIVKVTETCSLLCPQGSMKDSFTSTCLF